MLGKYIKNTIKKSKELQTKIDNCKDKDFLLKELCEELFCHIFDTESHNQNGHKHIFDCDSSDAVFLHLLRHLPN